MSLRSPRVLVVDDEADLRELLELTLLKMGLDVDSAATLAQARARLAERSYQLVLTDMRLPDGMGLELVREAGTLYKSMPIAVVTAYGSADNAVAALKAGAFDYITKPVALDQLRLLVRSALRLHQDTGASFAHSATTATTASAAGVAHAGEQGYAYGAGEQATDSRLQGASDGMAALRARIARLARSMAPVAIHGESGSGKELAAREIHAHSARADRPFIAVNCGAIPEALMEAEFFGYRKGAFTGAVEERDGFFQAADGGTLLLDEVADLPLAMQVKLLRAIQERRVRKLGATAEEPVDVRIISATHRNLAQCVEQGSFRQDLYYRLNVIELAVPPLRERQDDLPALVMAILARLAGNATAPAMLGPGVLEALATYPFPGNVRELENILERALAFANDGVIEVADLALRAAAGATAGERAASAAGLSMAPGPEQGAASAAGGAVMATGAAAGTAAGTAADAQSNTAAPLPASLPDYLNQVERDIIMRALGQTQFNRTQAAQLLGISFRQLRYQMQKLNIQEPEA